MTQNSLLCCALSVSHIVSLLQLISVRLLMGTFSFTETVTLLNTTKLMPSESSNLYDCVASSEPMEFKWEIGGNLYLK